MPSKNESVLNPKTTKYEFLGPIGAFLMITVLPILTCVLHLSCQFDDNPSRHRVEGTQLRDGSKLKYKMNGFYSMILTLFIIISILNTKGHEPLLFIDDHFIGLITSSIIVAFILSLYVYLDSFQEGKLLALELNPRIGSFDIKCFVELRPGLICWTVVNIAMAIKQYHELGYVTIGMFLILIFQGWYCIDAVYNEPITTDGFGWMLSFGNFTWVGFLYTLQARYLALHPVHLSRLQIIFIICLQAIGYAIFRGANNEKIILGIILKIRELSVYSFYPFYLKYITTEAGSRLIISGWWGRARHINYLGFDDILPYFYIVYFAVLLIHREFRDEEKCKNKYKKDWNRYCEIVKWRIIP
ncbi:7888_t:CDS:2, partial [Dentiscutata erythropus]